MTRILHLSDVHFGAVDPRLVEPSIQLAHDLRPDITVISGDFTQRAR
ncbi:MAG: metallophosphoesterase, partial [Acetobacteraceae bacterium]